VRVLICGINYAPEVTGIGNYTGDMAEWLANQGQDVRVVAAPPYYPGWKVGHGYSSWRYRRERIAGVDVWRCPLYVPAKPSGLKRVLHLASFAISSFPAVLRQVVWRPHVVMVVAPALFCAPTAAIVARLSGSKAWLHIQDFEIAAALALGILPEGYLARMALTLEAWLFRRFDCVSTISLSMLNRLLDKGVVPERAVLFPNWVDCGQIRYDPDGAKSFRDLYGKRDDQLLVLYAGNMGEKQGLEVVIEAAQLLAGRGDIRFLMCGGGSAKAELEHAAHERKLSNIAFLPLQSVDRLPAMLSAADIHLVIQRRDAADLVLPSKIAAILAVGGHALLTADEDTELGRLAVENPGMVTLCEPEDAQALALAIASLAGEGRECVDRRRSAARSYAEQHLAKEQVLSDFLARLDALSLGGNAARA